MLCEYAVYKTSDKYEKPYCSNVNMVTDGNHGEICPLIYYCPITERFENTEAMLKCKYREANK